MLSGATYKCEGCKKTQHVDPRDFAPNRTELSMLIHYYGWHMKEDKLYCPTCANDPLVGPLFTGDTE